MLGICAVNKDVVELIESDDDDELLLLVGSGMQNLIKDSSESRIRIIFAIFNY